MSLDAKAKRVDEIEGEWEASDNFRYLADAYLPTLTIGEFLPMCIGLAKFKRPSS